MRFVLRAPDNILCSSKPGKVAKEKARDPHLPPKGTINNYLHAWRAAMLCTILCPAGDLRLNLSPCPFNADAFKCISTRATAAQRQSSAHLPCDAFLKALTAVEQSSWQFPLSGRNSLTVRRIPPFFDHQDLATLREHESCASNLVRRKRRHLIFPVRAKPALEHCLSASSMVELKAMARCKGAEGRLLDRDAQHDRVEPLCPPCLE
eukprot:scaffold144790_cov36-Tisochrysis_lutea.AAC.3